MDLAGKGEERLAPRWGGAAMGETLGCPSPPAGRVGASGAAVSRGGDPAYASAMPSPFERHIHACNTAGFPGELLPFRIEGALAGWVRPEVASALRDTPAHFRVEAGQVLLAEGLATPEARTAALGAAAERLVAAGLCTRRDEAFDLRACLLYTSPSPRD